MAFPRLAKNLTTCSIESLSQCARKPNRISSFIRLFSGVCFVIVLLFLAISDLPQKKQLIDRESFTLADPSLLDDQEYSSIPQESKFNIMTDAILGVEKMPLAGPFPTQDPFLFCAYHFDDYPAGNEKMEAPRKGNGQDFDPHAPYRMYHGDRIPGFPQHPHRGFETITVTLTGLIDHTDSLGGSGRYGFGDLQWMTAGRGIVHGEMFPLLNMDKPNPARLFQLWLNLPRKNKMVEPTQLMHWSENIHKWKTPDEKVEITLYFGELEGKKSQRPPSNSYAVDPENDVAIYYFTLQPGGKYTIPKTKKGTNRSLYLVEGKSSLNVDGKAVPPRSIIKCKDEREIEIQHTETDASAGTLQVLMLQGKPINEPVRQYGPFAMTTDQEIQQAFYDYRTTRFGGWPWEEDAVVFGREVGRFVSMNGKKEYPPTSVGK